MKRIEISGKLQSVTRDYPTGNVINLKEEARDKSFRSIRVSGLDYNDVENLRIGATYRIAIEEI